MKAWMLAGLLALQGPDRDGLELYAEGRFADAAAAFAAAIASQGESPELLYNLALARWRAGELAAAEEAAEKMAALGGGRFAARHFGMLGAVRHAESQALERQSDEQRAADLQASLAPLEQALDKARSAVQHFARAGAGAGAGPEVVRNLERELVRISALEKKLVELKQELERRKHEQEKQDQEKQDQQDKEQKQDQQEQQQKEQQEKEQQQKEQQQKEQQQKEGQKPEPKQPEGEPEPRPEPQPKEAGGQEQPQPGHEPGAEPKRHDAPGEMPPGELSPEQRARLLQQLEQLDSQLKALRARARASRPAVERDW